VRAHFEPVRADFSGGAAENEAAHAYIRPVRLHFPEVRAHFQPCGQIFSRADEKTRDVPPKFRAARVQLRAASRTLNDLPAGFNPL
jgi:hypothetical protein